MTSSPTESQAAARTVSPAASRAAGALRFLSVPAPRGGPPAVAREVTLSFRDGSSKTFDASSPAGRAFRALAEVLALRSRPVRSGEEK